MKTGDIVYYFSPGEIPFIGLVMRKYENGYGTYYTINWWGNDRYYDALELPENQSDDVFVIGSVSEDGNEITVAEKITPGYVKTPDPEVPLPW